MPAYSVTCPECRASLKSSRPIAPGTPLECPKCQVMFAAPAARPKPRPRAEVVDDVEVIDDVEVLDDVEVVDDDAPARPRAKSAARPAPKNAVNSGIEVVDNEFDDYEEPHKKRFKAKKSSKGGGSGLTIALVAVGAVILLGGLGALAWWLMSGGVDDPLAYAPPDSQIVVGIDGAALLNSSFGPKIEQLLDSPAFPLAKYKQETKTSNKDLLQRVVVGLRREGSEMKGVVAVKGGAQWDLAKLAAAFGGANKESAAGATVYRVRKGAETSTLVAPSKTVVVFADMPDAQLAPILKSKGMGLTGDLATLVNKGSASTLYVATVLDSATREQVKGMTATVGGGSLSLKAAVQTAKGAAMWATLGSTDLEVKAAILMPDADQAQKVTTDLQAEAQQQAAASKAMMAILPVPAAVKALMQEMTDTQQFTTDGNMAVMTMKVKTATLDTAVGELANMAAMFGGGAGQQPPGGGLPGRGRR